MNKLDCRYFVNNTRDIQNASSNTIYIERGFCLINMKNGLECSEFCPFYTPRKSKNGNFLKSFF